MSKDNGANISKTLRDVIASYYCIGAAKKSSNGTKKSKEAVVS